MQIILARHGKPKLPSFGWVSPREMGGWIDSYNQAEVEADGIPAETKNVANSSGVVATSTALRCVQSVQGLGCGVAIAESIFREAELPYLMWQFPKLPVPLWAGLFRLAWLFGFTPNAESKSEAMLRAKEAASRLVSLAQEHGSVFLMGHGVMTLLIAKHLRSLGWVGAARPHNDYWQFSVYHAEA